MGRGRWRSSSCRAWIVPDTLAKATPRTTGEVIAMEHRFYRVHDAVRDAQLGGDTVPEGFHPTHHVAGALERRPGHARHLGGGVGREDTDLGA